MTPATTFSPSPPGRHMSPRKRRRIDGSSLDDIHSPSSPSSGTVLRDAALAEGIAPARSASPASGVSTSVRVSGKELLRTVLPPGGKRNQGEYRDFRHICTFTSISGRSENPNQGCGNDPRARLQSEEASARRRHERGLLTVLIPYKRENGEKQRLAEPVQLCVSGFDPLRVREDQLKGTFSRFGLINLLRVESDPKSGQPLGVCSIEYRDLRDVKHKNKVTKTGGDAAKDAIATVNGTRLGNDNNLVRVVLDGQGAVAKDLLEQIAAHQLRSKEIESGRKPIESGSKPEEEQRQHVKIPSGPRLMTGRPSLPNSLPETLHNTAYSSTARSDTKLWNGFRLEHQGVRADLSPHIPYIFCQIAGKPPDIKQAEALLNKLRQHPSGLRGDRTGFFVQFPDTKDGRKDAEQCYFRQNRDPNCNLFNRRMTVTLVMESWEDWDTRQHQADRREQARRQRNRSKDRIFNENGPLPFAMSRIGLALINDLKRQRDALAGSLCAEAHRCASIQAERAQQSAFIPARDSPLTTRRTDQIPHINKLPMARQVSNPSRRAADPYLDERRQNKRDREHVEKQLQSSPSKISPSKPVRLHDLLDRDDSDSDSEQQSPSASTRASAEPPSRPPNRLVEKVNGRQRSSRSTSLTVNIIPASAEGEDNGDDVGTPRKKLKLGPSPLSQQPQLSPEQSKDHSEDRELSLRVESEIVEDVVMREDDGEDLSIKALFVNPTQGLLTPDSCLDDKPLLDHDAPSVVILKQESSDAAPNTYGDLVGESEAPGKKASAKALPKQSKKKQPKRVKPSKRQSIQEREAKKHLEKEDLESEPVAPDAELESSTDMSTTNAADKTDTIMEKMERMTHADIEEDTESVEEPIFEEWARPTEGQAQKTIVDDSEICMDLDGWQEYVKDDEDLEFLREALQEDSSTVIPAAADENLDIKAWAYEQKELKAMMRGGHRGLSRTELLIPGYYKPNSTGCARTEGYSKPLEDEKSKYLPHRLKVFREREERQTRAKHGDRTPLPTSAIARAAPPLGIESSRDRRANQRRHAFDMANQQALLSKASGGASVPADAEAFQFNQLKKRKKALRFDRSPIHNWGLFAMEPIAKDEMIIEYVGEVVRQAVADIRERRYDKMGLGSSYLFRLDEGWVIDASMKGSTARFVNHSCNPSCTARVVKVAGQKRIVIYALRAIEVGEELTYDYKFEREIGGTNRIPCLCGSDKCSGYLN